jgi:hypothetical protein
MDRPCERHNCLFSATSDRRPFQIRQAGRPAAIRYVLNPDSQDCARALILPAEMPGSRTVQVLSQEKSR